MENYSLADLRAATDNGNDGLFGGGGMWIFALLILLLIGGGNMFGNGGGQAATSQDLQRTVDLSSIQNGQRDIEARVQEVGAENISATKDAAYTNLGAIRDVQAAVSTGFAGMQTCCCETNRNIDSVRYDNARNIDALRAEMVGRFAATDANVTAQTQRVLDKMCADREADLTRRINQLEMQNAMCGVPKINPYGYGVYQYAPPVPPTQSTCCGCG